MAEELEQTKQCLEVLSESVDLASSVNVLSSTLELVEKFTGAFPLVGAVLGLVKAFLPNAEHEAILRCFEKLNNKIDQVRDDIRNLEKMIKWELTKLEYAEAVNRIEMALKFSMEMGNATQVGDSDRYARFQKRLQELCSNQEMTLAVDALLDGITGKGLFNASILDNMFSDTKGHRPKIAALSFRLFQLVSGGMIVLATYEASVRGQEAADEMIRMYDTATREAKSKIDAVLRRCVDEFEEHMRDDLKGILDLGGDNNNLSDRMLGLMREKYDWLETACVVYNDLWGFEYHCFNGTRVDILHQNRKCGIVFYRTASETPMYSDREYDVENIVGAYPAWFQRADERYEAIIRDVDGAGIGWSGCAVIWTRDSPVGMRSNMSAKVVYKVNEYATTLVILQ